MQLKKVLRIRSVLLAKTGLRIGMSRDQMAIGDLDNPVIRNPLTDEPYIPGSSLKGKLRYLLEWSLGGKYILEAKERHVYASDDPKDPVARIFGLDPDSDERSLEVARKRGPTRLLVRDAYLLEDSKRELVGGLQAGAGAHRGQGRALHRDQAGSLHPQAWRPRQPPHHGEGARRGPLRRGDGLPRPGRSG